MNPKLLLITDLDDRARLDAQIFVHSGMHVSVLNHVIAKNMVGTGDLEEYDLILIDMFEIDMFEDEDGGIAICKKLRPTYCNPILLLTYEQDERFLLRVYETGVDDCLLKPISIHLLLVKVQAWLRRSEIKDRSTNFIEAYQFQFDPVKNEVKTPQDNLVRLSQLEARLLYLLISHSGRTVETDTIMQRVWPESNLGNGDRHLLKALVHRLRRKIESDPTRPQYIHTVPNQGYSFHHH